MSRIRIERYEGPRDPLRPLFELAEDSHEELDSYIDSGEVIVAVEADRVVGHAQLIDAGRRDQLEIRNMAVVDSHQRRGIGSRLLEAAADHARERSFETLLVATAAADIDNLRFYQRAGFRMRAIERDAFTPAHGYPRDLESHGIALRDRVWLDLRLDAAGERERASHVRLARHTERLEEVVAFYRDGLGLNEIGGFRDHDGYDGVFLETGANSHLEFTSGGRHGAPLPHPESLLVLYMGDEPAVKAAAIRLGATPVPSANPYWNAHGLTFEDPDGFRIVLVPERWQP